MEKVYDTVVFGLTYLGCGFCSAKPENTLILEEKGLPGYEFSDSFNQRPPYNGEILTREGKEFYSVLQAMSAVNDEGQVYLGACVHGLAKIMQEKNIDCRFFTKVTEIKKEEDLYQITIFNTEGFSTVCAKRIVDTTSGGVWGHMTEALGMSKTLNIVVENSGSETFFRNPLSGDETYFYPVENDRGYKGIREEINRFWRENGLLDKGVKIIAIANSFACQNKIASLKGDGYDYFPSTAAKNPIHAFDIGAKEGSQL